MDLLRDEINSKRTWKWMIGIHIYTFTHFLLGWPIFRAELLVLGSVARENTKKNASKFFGFEKLLESLLNHLFFWQFLETRYWNNLYFCDLLRVNLWDSHGRKKRTFFSESWFGVRSWDAEVVRMLEKLKQPVTRWWNFKHFLFSPRTLGKWTSLTSIFFKGVGSTTNWSIIAMEIWNGIYKSFLK